MTSKCFHPIACGQTPPQAIARCQKSSFVADGSAQRHPARPRLRTAAGKGSSTASPKGSAFQRASPPFIPAFHACSALSKIPPPSFPPPPPDSLPWSECRQSAESPQPSFASLTGGALHQSVFSLCCLRSSPNEAEPAPHFPSQRGYLQPLHSPVGLVPPGILWQWPALCAGLLYARAHNTAKSTSEGIRHESIHREQAVSSGKRHGNWSRELGAPRSPKQVSALLHKPAKRAANRPLATR